MYERHESKRHGGNDQSNTHNRYDGPWTPRSLRGGAPPSRSSSSSGGGGGGGSTRRSSTPRVGRSSSYSNEKRRRRQQQQRQQHVAVLWRQVPGIILVAVLLMLSLKGIPVPYLGPRDPPAAEYEPAKPSPIPSPILTEICNHHHRIYRLHPQVIGLDLFEILSLDPHSAVFNRGAHAHGKNGLVTVKDNCRAKDVILDAIMKQVESNLDGSRKDESAAALRRIIVDTGRLLMDAKVRRMYIDGFVPIKERTQRREKTEDWLGEVCSNF